MASKSKKRRKVLGASCILAALIIAGSSFAWFTSKDEVTNRLTANSDYGVSIVESFVPPANWIPGQDINKDVYAVNTGNIDAYVKEDVSGKLTYTYEDIVDNFDPSTCVELPIEKARAIDAATTHEAGGFLAWTDAQVDGDTIYSYAVGEKSGLTAADFVAGTYDARNQNSAETPKEHITFSYMYEDADTGFKYYAESLDDGATFYRVHNYGDGNDVVYTTTNVNLNLTLSVNESIDGTTTYALGSVNSARIDDEIADTWNPPANGVYIFRRAIKTADDGTASFTYAGYRYEDGKYYKIVIGTDVYPSTSADSPNSMVYDVFADQASIGVAVDNDGKLLGDPAIHYVVENKVENVTPTLTYDTDETGKFLRVLYSEDQGKNDQLADLEATYNAAVEAYEQAKLDDSTSSTTLAQKEAALRNAEGAYNSAKSRYDQTYADWKYADTLTTETNKLVAQAKKTADKHAAFVTALDELNDAGKNLNDGADAQITALTNLQHKFDPDCTLNNNELVDANVRQYIANNGADATPGNSDLTNARANLALFDQYYADINTDITNLIAAYNAIKVINPVVASTPVNGDYEEDPTLPADVKAQYKIIKETVAKLKSDIVNYEAAFANFKDAVTPATETAPAIIPEHLLTGLVENDVVTDFTAAKEAAQAAVDYANDDLKTLVDTYETKYNALATAKQEMIAEDAAWVDAVKTYNKAVNGTDGAKKVYDTAIAVQQKLPNAFILDDGHLTNNGETLVPGDDGYSAVYGTVASKSGEANDPEIPEGTDFRKYASVVETPNVEHTVDVLLNRTVENEDTFKQLDANYANDEVVDDATVPQTLGALKGKMDTEEAAVEAAQIAFDAADADRTAKATAFANKTAAYNAAKTAFENGIADAATINIKVYLDADWETYWTMDPADVAGSEDVDFYLNKILKAGETSHKLIDSVKMDDTMSSRDYKDLTFDLNIGLDSMQVTYDADQRNYTAEAVNAADETFKLNVTNAAPITADTVLTWAE